MQDNRLSDTRARILDAAERLFMAHGYDGTSMRQITSEAGANLDHRLTRHRGDALHDRFNNVRVAQKMLTETLARDMFTHLI